MLSQQGIILRSFMPLRQRVIFFDSSEGVISVIPADRTIHAVVQGALAHYQLQKVGERLMVYHIEPIALPAIPLRLDLQFLHHVLEMLFRFLPMSMRLNDVYEHCLILYHDSISHMVERRRFQYLFLSKLFGMLGVYPHEDIFHRFKEIRSLVAQSFEDMLTHGCTIALDDLRIWLLGCIHTHHHARIFTTLQLY